MVTQILQQADKQAVIRMPKYKCQSQEKRLMVARNIIDLYLGAGRETVCLSDDLLVVD
jgi:hypothetical protein